MKKYIKTLVPVLTLLCSGICNLVLAQGDQYQFSRLNIDNGLSNNRVTCIYKDARGFMWFGTKSGLNRYDGYKFKVFKHNLNNQTSINDDYIISITTGPNQKLWVKTRNGFNIYDPSTDGFDHHIKAALQRYNIPDSMITALTKDRFGNFWFLHANKGIYEYMPSVNQSIHLTHSSADTSSVHAGNGTDFAADGNGNIWVVYSDGILEKLDYRTHRVTSRVFGINKAYPTETIEYHLSVDQQNDVWAYAPFRGNGVFFVCDKVACKHLGKATGGIKISSDIVFNVIQDDKGLIWIATDHGGINLLDKKTFTVKQAITNRPDDNRSLGQDCIVSLFKDNANIIWLGTFKKGVSYYHRDIIKFPLYRHQSSTSNSLSYDDVNRFVEDKKGNIWIGSNGGGLIYFDRAAGTFTTYLHNDANPNSLCNNVIASLYLDHEQKLWIGTYFGGLDCFDGKNFTHYKHIQSDDNSLSDNSVWEILEDSKKRLWIGTLSGGLNLFNREHRNFSHYLPGRPNSVPHQYVSGLVEDNKGNIWVATYGGLAVLIDKTNKFVYYKHNEADKESLSNDNVSNLMIDSRNLIWVATNEGLSMFDPKIGKFKNFQQAEGLPDNAVLTIVEDKAHNLWMSTLNGLSNLIITPKNKGGYNFEFKNYDQTDGLQGKEFNEDAALSTRSGELIFGGANGFNLFKPDNVKSTREKPVLVLTDLQLFNKSISSGEKIEGHVILNHSITETHELTLRHNENVFSIEFAAVNFFNPAKIKHAYKLAGFDKNWNIADNRVRKASYTNLDPGTYTFQLRAAGEDGRWTEKPLTLKITVLPPIWRTAWACLLYILMGIGTLLLIRQRGIRKLKADFVIQQERQEVQQMRELDLMKIKFFTNVSHEFRTPLSLILAPVDKLLKQSTDAEINKHLHMINRNGKRLLNLVNQLLDFRKMEVNELRLHSKRADIVKFIEDAAYSFSDIAESKKVTLCFNTQIESIITSFDEDKFERILFNLLSNAFKFTNEGGKIEVKLSFDDFFAVDKMLKIEVTDNGIGIPADKLDKIFDRFFQNDTPGSMVNQGSGIGLAITKEFVNLHHGTISVKSVVNKGSTFVVLLPVNPAHVLQDTDKNIFINRDAGALIDETAVTNNEQTEKKQQSDIKKPLVLLIEDNEDFRFYLKDNLKEHYRVTEAVDGIDGWQKVLATHPSLIVSDISMPGMNGIDLCHKIKNDSRTKHIPVILLTAITGQKEQLKGLETGASDYLTKPFNFEILLSKIKNQLSQQSTLKKTYQKQIDLDTAVSSVDINHDKFMVDIVKFIDKNIDNPDYSVEELSSDMAMSRVTLYRKTLLMTERTPVEFIKLCRLKKAAQLLANSNLNIAEIAYKVGFNNPKYFAKSFKQEFSTLPTDYRSLQKQKDAQLAEK
ncbi:hybrid sensor histidine kinase/response regulator transcription factor [Mucilaginibacter paludis]|nr:two-component regulator propeller domain-containing protein [Mucilaginibacter paludis]